MKKTSQKIANIKNNILKLDRGINLIALVVTITVILILVGVTIGTLNGENGIINQSKRLGETEQQEQENSQIQINELETKLAASEGNLTISGSELNALINIIVSEKLSQANYATKDEISNTIANYATKDEISNTILSSYPIGSIYISTQSTNPSEFIGGTWERIEDTFLLAAGSKYAAGTTGGEATHTLTINEMPSHRHNSGQGYYNCAAGSDRKPLANYLITSDPVSGNYTTYTGGGKAHNNMPPYLTVYVWKRVA